MTQLMMTLTLPREWYQTENFIFSDTVSTACPSWENQWRCQLRSHSFMHSVMKSRRQF